MRAVLLLLICALYACLADDTVFNDSPQNGFQDWGWGTKNPADTAKFKGGSKSYSFQPAAYSAAYLYKQGGISTSTYSGVTFWVLRTAATGVVNFNLVTYSAATQQSSKVASPDNSVLSYLGNNWPANQWVQVTVQFSAFPAGTYDGLWLQDQSGQAASYTVYIDEVVLISKSTTASTTGTTKAATTSTTKAGTTSTTKAGTTSTTKAGTTSTTKAGTTSTTKAGTTSTTKAGTTSTTKAGTTSTTKSATTGSTTSTTKSATTGSASTTGSGGTFTDADAAVMSLYRTPKTGGLATYYGEYTNGGACMLDPTPTAGQGIASVAIMTTQFMGSKTCGMCLSMTAVPGPRDAGDPASRPTGTRTVFVNNLCPSCEEGGLDLGLNGDGNWGIQYVAVPCPVGTTTIQYLFKGGSSAFWLGLQPRNTRYPVFTLEAQYGGNWVKLPRTDYNYFVASFDNGLVFPLSIRLTAVTGEVVTDTISSVQNGATIISNKQFQLVSL